MECGGIKPSSDSGFIPDESQQAIVRLYGERGLVLAGPGCGKTRILAERIIHAHDNYGIGFERMLCLTFTNRAAREMNQRIETVMGQRPDGLFVGNIHRFCSRFLYSNGILSPDVSIIDEEDQKDFFNTELNITGAAAIHDALSTGILEYEIKHDFPRRLQRATPQYVSPTLIEAAEKYERFKTVNNLVDFDDLILMTINATFRNDFKDLRYSDYEWIQVDEVQDLTPLQMELVSALRPRGGLSTCLYLGDSQQAIFAFLGAGGDGLTHLMKECQGNIYQLSKNYRCTPRLLDLCNSYALHYLGALPETLPTAALEEETDDGEENPLKLYYTAKSFHMRAISAVAKNALKKNPDEKITILTRTNAEANFMSQELEAQGIKHLLISNIDLFQSAAFKSILAHLTLLRSPYRTAEWARILYQTRCIKTLKEASSFLLEMKKFGALPSDFHHSERETELSRACRIMEGDTLTIIDTETTGLDVREDDIVEICCRKITRSGSITTSTTLKFFLETEKPLPAIKGLPVNPMVKILAQAPKTDAKEALEKLNEFIGESPLAGYNTGFDLRILKAYGERKAPHLKLKFLDNPTLDILSLVRLLYPMQRSMNLNSILELFQIEAQNSHEAEDDVDATQALMEYLRPIAETKLKQQGEFFGRAEVKKIGERYSVRYRPIYELARKRYVDQDTTKEMPLLKEFELCYTTFRELNYIKPIKRYKEVCALIKEVIKENAPETTTLQTQLDLCLNDIRTNKESDIVARGLAEENISVSTIHKAKGLEADHVIVFNASSTWGNPEEVSKVYYVALSRAKRRLTVFCQGGAKNAIYRVEHLFGVYSEGRTAKLLASDKL